jgi:hypothetical protein
MCLAVVLAKLRGLTVVVHEAAFFTDVIVEAANLHFGYHSRKDVDLRELNLCGGWDSNPRTLPPIWPAGPGLPFGDLKPGAFVQAWLPPPVHQFTCLGFNTERERPDHTAHSRSQVSCACTTAHRQPVGLHTVIMV